MANTTYFGWETPDDTDLVKDGAAAIRTLGQAIDTSMQDLEGGTTGQILSKNSNADMDFVWITNDVGDITEVVASTPLTGGGSSGSVTVGIQDGTTAQKGAVQLEDSTSSTSTTKASTPNSVKSAYDLANAAIPKSLVDAAGDLIYATANDTPARLAIGTAGQVLKVNSGATAPEWGAAGSGGMTLLSTTTLSGATTTISSISGAYKNLQLVIRSYRPASDNQELYLQFNGDSTANRHRAIATFGSATNVTFNGTGIQIAEFQDDGTDNNLTVVDIPDYANTVTWKMFASQSVSNNATTPTNLNRYIAAGVYNQTSAISSLVLFPGIGNFTSGTALLYGVS